MRHAECSESRKLAARELLSPADQKHLSSCGPCADYLTVASAMGRLEAETSYSTLPPAKAVFIRARILGRRRLATDSARPLIVFQKVAAGTIAVCWLVFLIMQWAPVTRWLSGIEVGFTSGIQSTSSLPMSFFWMFTALSLMTMMTMVHGIWTEEHA